MGYMDLTPYLDHVHDWNPDLDLNQIRVDSYGLGKHTVGKSCLYVKKLADVDEPILRELIRQSVNHMRVINL
jgi:hypothetical protein